MIGVEDNTTSPVAGYLGTSIYYPNEDKKATFVTWSSIRHSKSIEEIVKSGHDLSMQEHKPALFIMDWPVSPPSMFQLSPDTSFVGSIVNEDYFLYTFTNQQ
jgi:hypothetical protein